MPWGERGDNQCGLKGRERSVLRAVGPAGPASCWWESVMTNKTQKTRRILDAVPSGPTGRETLAQG